MGTYTKLTRSQRKALKAWRKSMVQSGYSRTEIDAAIQSGDALAEITADAVIGTSDQMLDTSAAYGSEQWDRDYRTSVQSALTLPGGKAGAAVARVWCNHPATKKLFTIGASDIYAGARWDCKQSAQDAELTLDLTGMTRDEAIITPPRYSALRDYVTTVSPTITLNWPDHGLPPVVNQFWLELVKLLPAGKVVVCCVGGHGRTGTALAALLIVTANLDAKTAIEFVWANHCQQAIETKGQQSYLDQLAAWWKGGTT